jgi:ABC-2 type transport system ATP-binding protein
MNNSVIVEVKNLNKTYKGNLEPAVDNLSFNVYENEIFGLLGPNGAGKTTTISTLCSLLKPSSGSIKIASLDIANHLDAIKKLIGVVSQDIALYDKLTAYENLYYFGSLYGINKNVLKERIDASLQRLGLHKNKHVTINKYSGGMKRRINLLAGVLHKPRLLFLDEPTVGVDVQTRNVIREFLDELRNNGTTIIYSSHLMEDIQILCDRVVIIDHGKLVSEGKPSELIVANANCNSLEDVFLKLTGHKLRD